MTHAWTSQKIKRKNVVTSPATTHTHTHTHTQPVKRQSVWEGWLIREKLTWLLTSCPSRTPLHLGSPAMPSLLIPEWRWQPLNAYFSRECGGERLLIVEGLTCPSPNGASFGCQVQCRSRSGGSHVASVPYLLFDRPRTPTSR